MHRLAAVLVALAIAGASVPASAVEVPGIPGLNISGVARTQTESTPAAIVGMTWAKSSQGVAGSNYIQCADFRVLSRKAIASVRFTIRFQDEFGNTHFTWNIDRRGSFAPGTVVSGRFDSSVEYGNQGDQSCWVIPVGRDIDTGLSRVTKAVIETRQVAFTDGSTWQAGQSFDQAFTPTGDRFPALRVSTRWANEGRAPVVVLRGKTQYDAFGSPQQCVSFRNVTGRVATSIDFDFNYADASNNSVITRSARDSGTYTPPIEIDDQCWNESFTSDQLRRIAFNDVHVKRVTFNDGTVWNEGQGFTRTFGNNGAPMPPTDVAAGSSQDSRTVLPPVEVTGVGDGNPPPGARFGVIAINARATIAALARDRESAGAAMADAIDKCNTQSGDNSCTAQLQFDRCGAVAMRRLENVPVVFFGKGNTLRDAEAEALSKAGMGASILQSGCNS